MGLRWGNAIKEDENNNNQQKINETLNKRIEELRKWQNDQQYLLKKRQIQQIVQLREERKNIREMFQRKRSLLLQPEDCLPVPSDKTDCRSNPVSPKSWNKLFLPNCSPLERLERASQLTCLLKEAESKSEEFLPAYDVTNVNCLADILPIPKKENMSALVKEQKSELSCSRQTSTSGLDIYDSESLTSASKFPFLRKGQSLTKFKMDAMTCPELCLGVRQIFGNTASDTSFQSEKQSKTMTGRNWAPRTNQVVNKNNDVIEQLKHAIETVKETSRKLKSASNSPAHSRISSPVTPRENFSDDRFRPSRDEQSVKENSIRTRDIEDRRLTHESLPKLNQRASPAYRRENEDKQQRNDLSSNRSNKATSTTCNKEFEDKSKQKIEARNRLPEISHIKKISPSRSVSSYHDQSQNDLKEFEILERASEESSFCSNSSIVMKALQFRTLQSKYGSKLERNLKNIVEKSESSDAGAQTNSQTTSDLSLHLLKSESNSITNSPRTAENSCSMFDFRDEFSWHSAAEEVSCTSNISLSGEDFSPRPMALSKTTNCIPSTFMNRYFTNSELQKNQNVRSQVEKKSDGDHENIMVIQEKVKELQQEINKFQKENEQLKLYKAQHKVMQRALESAKQVFEKFRVEEEARINTFLDKEKQKMKKERELYDAYLKTRPQQDKHDRKELAKLKKELEEANEVIKERELKWNMAHKRLQDRIHEMEMENTSLKCELHTAEKRNLELTATIQEINSKPESRKTSANNEVENVINTSEDCTYSSLWTDTQLSSNSLLRSNPDQLSHAENAELFTLNPKLTLIDKCDIVVTTVTHEDNSVENVYDSGTREIKYPNGTRKEISKDDKCVFVFLFNGDIKQIFSDEKIVYYFAENETTHTTYPDGLQVFHFINNQLEKHYPDGSKQITFPDKSVKFIFTDGSEESVLADGTRIQTNSIGDCVMQFPDGQKEIHTDKFKKRIFPDGTVKLLYPSGEQETRFANGRVRVKSKDGTVLTDLKKK